MRKLIFSCIILMLLLFVLPSVSAIPTAVGAVSGSPTVTGGTMGNIDMLNQLKTANDISINLGNQGSAGHVVAGQKARITTLENALYKQNPNGIPGTLRPPGGGGGGGGGTPPPRTPNPKWKWLKSTFVGALIFAIVGGADDFVVARETNESWKYTWSETGDGALEGATKFIVVNSVRQLARVGATKLGATKVASRLSGGYLLAIWAGVMAGGIIGENYFIGPDWVEGFKSRENQVKKFSFNHLKIFKNEDELGTLGFKKGNDDFGNFPYYNGSWDSVKNSEFGLAFTKLEQDDVKFIREIKQATEENPPELVVAEQNVFVDYYKSRSKIVSFSESLLVGKYVIESPEKISTMSGGDKALYWTIGAVDEITLGWSSTKRRAIVRSADNWANFTKTFKPFGGVYDSAIPSGRSIEIYTTDGVHPKEVEGGYRCDGRNAYNGQIIDCLIYNLKDDGIYIVDMRQKFGFINYLSMVDSMPDFESAFEKNDCGAGLAGEVNSNAKNFFCQQALNGIYDLDAGDFTSDGILKVKEFIEGLEQYRNIVGSKQAGTVQSVFPAETMTIANYLIYNKNNTAALANYKYFLATAIYGLPTQVLVIKGDPTGLYGPVAADIIGGDTAVVVQGDVLTIKVNTPGKASMINAFREYAGDQALNLAKLGSLMSFHDATGNQLSAEVVAVGNNIKVYLEKGMFNEGEAYYVLIDLPSGNKKIAQIKLNLDNVQMVGPIAVVSQEEPCVAVIPETSAVMAEGGVEYPEGTDYYYTTFIEYDTVSAQAYNPDGDILHTETFNIETEEDVDFSAVPINELDDVSQAAYYAAEEEAVVNIQLWLSEEVGPPIGTVSGAVEVVESATNMCPVITNDVPQVLVNLGSLGGTNGINTNVVFEVALSGVGINGSTNTNDFVIAKGTNDVDNINTNEMKFYAIGAPTNVLDVGVNTNNQVIVSNGVTNAFVDFTPLSSNGVEAVVLNDVAITSTNDTVNLGGTNAVVLVPGTNVIVNIPQTNDLGVVSNAVCDIALLTNGVSSNLVVDCGADGSNMVDLASIGSNGVSGVESNLLVPVGRNWEQVLGVGTNGTNFIEALVVPVIDPTKGTNDLGVVIKTNSGVEAEVTFPVIGGN